MLTGLVQFASSFSKKITSLKFDKMKRREKMTTVYKLFSRFQEAEFIFLSYVQNKLRRKSIDAIMPFITKIGNLGAIWFVLAFILFLGTSTRIIGLVIVFGLFNHVIFCNYLLKNIVARSRPSLSVNDKKNTALKKDYSFPSGHACSSFIVVTILYLFSSPIYFVALPLSCLMAISRIYLGAHYPSDVIGGIIIGSGIGYLTYHLSMAVIS